jgi:hypothetical protein
LDTHLFPSDIIQIIRGDQCIARVVSVLSLHLYSINFTDCLVHVNIISEDIVFEIQIFTDWTKIWPKNKNLDVKNNKCMLFLFLFCSLSFNIKLHGNSTAFNFFTEKEMCVYFFYWYSETNYIKQVVFTSKKNPLKIQEIILSEFQNFEF